MTLYILEMTTQKSKVLESVTAQRLILILTLECIWHNYYARDKCGHTNQQRDTEIIKQFWDQVAASEAPARLEKNQPMNFCQCTTMNEACPTVQVPLPQVLLMDLVPEDKVRGLKTPVWDEYKRIINEAEGKQVGQLSFLLQFTTLLYVWLESCRSRLSECSGVDLWIVRVLSGLNEALQLVVQAILL